MLHAQVNFQVVHSFGGPGDGFPAPYAGVVFDQHGNMYSTTVGTVFEFAPDGSGGWTESILHNFNSPGDGHNAFGGVIVGQGGALYGTTANGGTHGGPQGYGTVYQLTQGPSGWTESVIYDFNDCCNNTHNPYAGVVQDAAGNLYGVGGGGGVFKLTPGSGTWTENVICSKGGCAEGGLPGLGIAHGGQLFAVSDFGGAYGWGNVYALVPVGSGWSEIDLYDLGSAQSDGRVPSLGALAYDGRGHLYGSMEQGGSNVCYDTGCGTIYEVSRGADSKWTETILYNFTPDPALGNTPIGGVILDKAGNLYGTTSLAGTGGQGVVYELERSGTGWSYKVLHTFVGTDGSGPEANLTFDANGNLFGTTVTGGTILGRRGV